MLAQHLRYSDNFVL